MKRAIVASLIFSITTLVQARILRMPSDRPTLAEAVRAASAGDTVLVARGTYTQPGLLKIDKPITLASAFVLSNNPSDVDQTVIRPALPDMKEWVELAVENSSVIGLRFAGADEHILNITAPVATVLHCKFYNGGDQVSLSGGGGRVAYCYFEGAGDDGIDCDNSVSWTIEYNTIVNAHQDGIEVRLQPKGGPLTTHVFRHNRVVGSGESGIQVIDYQGNSFREFCIHHNVFVNCRGAGVSCMYQEKDDSKEVYRGSLMEEQAFVYNNTFISGNVGITVSPRLIVLNNLFANLRTRGIERGIYVNDANDRSMFDFCLFYGNPQNADTGVRLGGRILTDRDPQLAGNQELRDGSPCIDAGTAEYRAGETVFRIPASEYAGKAPDLGAKEYGYPNWESDETPAVDAGPDR